jgi:amino acid permease
MHGYTINTRRTHISSVLVIILIIIVLYYFPRDKKREVHDMWTTEDVYEHMLWNGGPIRW